MLLCLTFLSLAASALGALSSVTDQTVLAPGNRTDIDTLSASIAKCPGELHWLALGNVVKWIDLLTLKGDSSGCLYDVLDGWPGKGPAVAKTATQPNVKYKENEKDALQQIEELYASGQDTESSMHWWLVMKKHDGMDLRDTSAYNEYVGPGKNTQNCRAFVGAVYDVVATNVAHYVREYGAWHLDLHLSNILFDDRVATAQLVDWEFWRSVDQSDDQVQAAYNYGYETAQALVPLDTCL